MLLAHVMRRNTSWGRGFETDFIIYAHESKNCNAVDPVNECPHIYRI
jgi:hypothetical protein